MISKQTTTKAKKSNGKTRTAGSGQHCLCGCGRFTKGGTFCPGDDAVLKGKMIKVHGSEKVMKLVSEIGVAKAYGRLGLRRRASKKPAVTKAEVAS
jgi:hypothetical protein